MKLFFILNYQRLIFLAVIGMPSTAGILLTMRSLRRIRTIIIFLRVGKCGKMIYRLKDNEFVYKNFKI